MRTSSHDLSSCHPDATLLALGCEFLAIRDQYVAERDRLRAIGRYIGDDAIEAVFDRTGPIVERASKLRAMTVAGVRIKAVMAEWESESLDVNAELATSEFANERILWSIVRDLIDGFDSLSEATISPIEKRLSAAAA